MTPGKNKRVFIIALFYVLTLIMIFAEWSNDIQFNFTRNVSGYSFYGNSRINADPKCITETSFQYEHIYE